MTFAEVKEFINNNPQRANELAKAAQQTISSDSLTPELELGREILMVLPYLDQSASESQIPRHKRSQVPGLLGGLSFIPFAFRKKQVMEDDRKYNQIKKQKLKEFEKEWKENNPGKDFKKSQERVDFEFGSLENPGATNLRAQTEKAFREQYAKKAVKFDGRKSKTKRNPTNDSALAFLRDQLRLETSARYSLFLAQNPQLQTKELDKELQRISAKIKEKRWEEFVKRYPEKATEYRKEQYKKYNKRNKDFPVNQEINLTFQRIWDKTPKITGEEKLDDKLREFYNKETEKNVPEEKKEIQITTPAAQTPPIQPVYEPIQKQAPTPSPRFQKPTFETVRTPRFKNLRLPGRGGFIDRFNRLTNRGREANQAKNMAKQVAKKAAKKVMKAATKNPYVLAVIIAICVFIFLILAIILFFSVGESTTPGPTPTPPPPGSEPLIPGLELHKELSEAKPVINTGDLIKYTITTTYNGDLDVTVVDPIDQYSRFESATGTYKLDIPDQQAKIVKSVSWKLKENVKTGTGADAKYVFYLTIKAFNPNASYYQIANQAYATAGSGLPDFNQNDFSNLMKGQGRNVTILGNEDNFVKTIISNAGSSLSLNGKESYLRSIYQKAVSKNVNPLIVLTIWGVEASFRLNSTEFGCKPFRNGFNSQVDCSVTTLNRWMLFFEENNINGSLIIDGKCTYTDPFLYSYEKYTPVCAIDDNNDGARTNFVRIFKKLVGQ